MDPRAHPSLSNQLTLRAYYTKKLLEATHRITFLTPYFIPHKWLLTAMKNAVERGITVELLIPEATDSRILDAINRYYASKALDLGAQLYISPGTNHAKAVLIDDREGMIGSGNIDALSFERNSELGIFFTDDATVHNLAHIITHWKSSATHITEVSAYRLPWYYFPFIFILKILHPFL